MMAQVLLTAFEAFGGDEVNPTKKIVEQFDKKKSKEIKTLVLPVVFDACLKKLENVIETHKPQVVLALGLAGGREMISLERVAINVNDARIPDNAGFQPIDTCVIDNAPDAYFSRLPIKRILKKLQDNDIPGHVSNSAGTYVCNHLMFGLLHLIHTRFPEMQGGFIHVPYLPEQVKDPTPSVPLDVMVKAIDLCLEECLKSEGDIPIAAGTTQ